MLRRQIFLPSATTGFHASQSLALIVRVYLDVAVAGLVPNSTQKHREQLGCAKPTDPLRKFTELYPAELFAFARTEVPPTAEAVFFGGNVFRAIGMIAALEEELGRPVLTGNQVTFWYALRQAGVRKPVNGYGRLFRTLDPEGR